MANSKYKEIGKASEIAIQHTTSNGSKGETLFLVQAQEYVPTHSVGIAIKKAYRGVDGNPIITDAFVVPMAIKDAIAKAIGDIKVDIVASSNLSAVAENLAKMDDATLKALVALVQQKKQGN